MQCTAKLSVIYQLLGHLMAASSSTGLSLSFPCGLRGYHEYRAIWTPVLHEILPAIHERSNPHDRYAIAARKSLPGTTVVESTVGHLPREISRLTRFIMQHGAIVVVKVIDTHHRRSPLVQGGLEIPIELIVKMEYSPQNKVALCKYESLVEQYYKEPVDGKFEDVTDTVLKDLEYDADEETDNEADDWGQTADSHCSDSGETDETEAVDTLWHNNSY